MKINVKELVGIHAISMQSGQFLYKDIQKNLTKGTKIQVDFDGVKFFASPFFNASFGYLIKDSSVEKLMDQIEIINISVVGRRLLNLVITNAINFYKNSNEQNNFIISKNADEI